MRARNGRSQTGNSTSLVSVIRVPLGPGEVSRTSAISGYQRRSFSTRAT
ncbi:MAG TPA: hypothetical protein VML91_11485 [Burkholderiales bacterium]|nr:hypothetical protein [Burkholderiales bacterium]